MDRDCNARNSSLYAANALNPRECSRRNQLFYAARPAESPYFDSHLRLHLAMEVRDCVGVRYTAPVVPMSRNTRIAIDRGICGVVVSPECHRVS